MLGTNIGCSGNYRLVFTKTVVIILNVRYKLNKFAKYRVNEFYNFLDVKMSIKYIGTIVGIVGRVSHIY
jgi:hypothetical protein